ncbi:MAG TPA: SDR family NAD(P)-dependent oxidoreductase, partial [Thermoanaerobaculia bacterium]|nr:SDR family NAD(P)-dependent oxidoreductase [Thermoanaerobaculia bacterium]
ARLRERGVYLITGGFGGLGLEVADWLARTVSARLVLVGRTPLAEDDRRLDRIRELEALGAEVMVAAADVTDEAALAAVRDQATARFGAVHGVIHAAGRPGGGIIQRKTRDLAEAVLAPKVRGALALDRVFAELPLDFLVLFSSITAVLAQPGQADYAAANAFLDAFARERTARGAFTLSIGWDAWRETGMAVATEVPDELKAWREEELKRGMTSTEGVEALRRALGAGVPWLVVSTEDLPARIERNRASRTEEELDKAREVRESHPRPLLANACVPPRTEAERRVAAVWEELLGIEGIGVHDNFFDLGGNSLMAIRIISRLKSTLGVDVSEVSIFEGPTVAALAKLLEPEEEGGEEAYEDQKSRGERRRAARRGRRAAVEVS